MPQAVAGFELAGYDLIISSSHCVAKGVIPPPGAVHVCYCHTPMRYLWDQRDDYLRRVAAPAAPAAAVAARAPAHLGRRLVGARRPLRRQLAPGRAPHRALLAPRGAR